MAALPGWRYTLGELAQITGGQVLGSAGSSFGQVTADSRQLGASSAAERTLFVALQARRNGHRFIPEAWRAGVRCFLVAETAELEALSDQTPPGQQPWAAVRVTDTWAALQQLAAHHRNQFTGQVLAITGSNGKTTVKEWLAEMLLGQHAVLKSPRSYNSQLGVALSLLQIGPEHQLALIECGVSEQGEMARLERMVRPELGLMGHFGDAHDEGFPSRADKLREKLLLFRDCRQLISLAEDEQVQAEIQRQGLPNCSIGRSQQAHWRVEAVEQTLHGWTFRLQGWSYQLNLPGPAALENAWLALAAGLALGLAPSLLQERLARLSPVALRTELVSENPEVTILNDSYNADAASIRNAFALLNSLDVQPHKRLILTDLDHLGAQAEAVQLALAQEAAQRFGPQAVQLVGPRFCSMQAELPPGVETVADVQDLLQNLPYERYRRAVVLLKGARRFRLERLIPRLSRQASATYFQFDLDALQHNYRQLRQRLPPGVRSLAMLKAAAYGAGAWQAARALEPLGLDYIGVAYTGEGIALREKGVATPILVLSPDPASLAELLRWRLEPALGNHSLLADLQRLLRLHPPAQPLPIHLEVDTGMARLGFAPQDLQQADWLHPQTLGTGLRVASVFTHLAAAEDPQADDFTQRQLADFRQVLQHIRVYWPEAISHALNTAGALRWPEQAGELVRLGIGLYGVDPRPPDGAAADNLNLQEAGSLRSAIAQLHHYPPGITVGYNRAQRLERPTRIATVPLGYADGVPRRLGLGRASMLVRGRLCPTVGHICMDLLMLDVTDAPGAAVGDEVVVFGRQASDSGLAELSVRQTANWAETIPYEILAGIPARVRRVYVQE